jgi:hypothetical protein
MEELQLEKTKNAIRQVFIDTGITPFEDGMYNTFNRVLGGSLGYRNKFKI